MYTGLVNAAAKQRRRQKTKVLQFGPWHGGLLTRKQAEQASRSDCSELLNFVLFDGGIARTRPGTELLCSGVTGTVVDARAVYVTDGYYTFLAGMSGSSYRLYLRDGNGVIDIGGLEGKAKLVGYVGHLAICDGGTLKYVDDVDYSSWATSTAYAVGDLVAHGGKGYRCIVAHTSGSSTEPGTGASYTTYWEQTWINAAYDNGTGLVTNYQFSYRTEINKGSLALGNGTIERVSQRFTSKTWTENMPIPPTVFYAMLSKTGNGYVTNDPVYFRLRKVSDNSIVASKTIVSSASELPDDPEEYSVVLEDSDITTKMETGTEYLAGVEFASGDASNYVNVHYTNNDGGTGKLNTYASGSWTSDTAKDLRGALKPGPAPKLKFAMVAGGKLMGIEGSDGANPSYLWYCDSGNIFDWSSPDGGGYVQAMDKHAKTFPIGAVASFYKEVYLFGTKSQPFFGRLVGASPVTWQVDATLQKVSGYYNSVIVTPDDIYFRHKGGVDAITTVQTYGDLAAVSQTDAISNILVSNFSTDDIAGYEPTLGLYLLKPDGHTYTYAVHTRLKSVRQQGLAQVPFSPATRWKFAFAGAPSCFGEGDGYLMIGTDDGKLYKIDDDLVQDADIDLTYKLHSYYPTTGFGELQTYKVNQVLSGKFGGSFDVNFHINHSREVFDTVSFALPWDTDSEPSDMTMEVDEALFLIDPATTYYDREYINFNFRALMVSLDNLVLNGSHIYFGPLNVQCFQIGGF